MNKRLLPWLRKHLKKMAGFGALSAMTLALSGCPAPVITAPTTSAITAPTTSAPSTPTAAQTKFQEEVVWHNNCVIYQTGFAGALAAGQLGLLTPADIAQVNLFDMTITPLCGKVPPANLQESVVQISQAALKLGIYEMLVVRAKNLAQPTIPTISGGVK